MKAALRRSYVNAEVDDALIVTMVRILGSCWAYDYERTPALTPEQEELVGNRQKSPIDFSLRGGIMLLTTMRRCRTCTWVFDNSIIHLGEEGSE